MVLLLSGRRKVVFDANELTNVLRQEVAEVDLRLNYVLSAVDLIQNLTLYGFRVALVHRCEVANIDALLHGF
jgi:hypothetical protein